jgi:hypothetical protein
MVARHRERARELIEAVPERPDVDDESVVERLRERRDTVVGRLDAPVDDGERPLHRLRRARGLRQDAAVAAAAYRAATDGVERSAVADRRSALRERLLAFERDWTYRGDDPATALAVHAALEELRLDARPALAPESAFPASPGSDPFGVGELVGDIERGGAALTDAERLRTRYLEDLAEPWPYRTALSVAAVRLRAVAEEHREEVARHVDPVPETPPFDRSIAGTPLERLYFWAGDGVAIFSSDAEQARLRGDHAARLLSRGVDITVLRALGSIVADIENERVSSPGSAADIVAARERAVGRLERAWSTEPTVLAPELAHWAHRLVVNGTEQLRTGADRRDAVTAGANFVTGARVATAVSPTAGEVRSALRAATA